MGQVIDIEERRRPRHLLDSRAAATSGMLAAFTPADVGQMLYPAMTAWRSWMASWTTLWLAPIGLQVSAIELRAGDDQDRARPHR